MLGGKNQKPLGYTVIELMIVLAVSGVMFLIAASFVNGKQEQTAFTTGSNNAVSLLQSAAEDVVDGHYSDIPIPCSKGGGGSLDFTTGSAGNQGEHQDCVFLGKLVNFFYLIGSGDRVNYRTFSLATGRGATDYSQATAVPTLTIQGTLSQDIHVESMHVIDTSGGDNTTAFSIGFAQGLGTIDASSGTYLSGTQPVSLIYANDPASYSTADLVGTIQPARSATICLTDGTRYAEVFIGGSSGGVNSNNNNQLNISAQQLGTTACS